MKELLKKMLTGWALHNNQPEDLVTPISLDECMLKAGASNDIEASLLALFGYWANDIQTLAAHYGLRMAQDALGQFVVHEDVPPAPSENHWFDGNGWVELDTSDETAPGEAPKAD